MRFEQKILTSYACIKEEPASTCVVPSWITDRKHCEIISAPNHVYVHAPARFELDSATPSFVVRARKGMGGFVVNLLLNVLKDTPDDCREVRRTVEACLSELCPRPPEELIYHDRPVTHTRIYEATPEDMRRYMKAHGI